MAIKIKQGDRYNLPVAIEMGGVVLTPDIVETVEFMLGGHRKLFPGEVQYSPEDESFHVPVTQEESFAWPAGETVWLDFRVKFPGGAEKKQRRRHRRGEKARHRRRRRGEHGGNLIWTASACASALPTRCAPRSAAQS